MLGFIKATIIIMACAGAASFLLRFFNREFNPLPLLITWGLVIAAIFLTQNYLVIMAIIIGVKVLYLKNDLEKNILFFLALIISMPYSFLWPVVPGVNLFDVSIIHILSIVFFLPLVFKILLSEDISLEKPDFAVMLFFFILIFGNFRESSEWEFTWFQAFRQTADMLFAYILPYFILSRGIKDFAALERVLPGLLFGGLTMMFFAYAEAILHWRPYVDIGYIVGTMPDTETMYEYRNGILRTTASLTGPITFGFYLTIILASLLYYMRAMNVLKTVRIILACIALMAIFMTGSRAALLGGVLFILLYFIYSLSPGARRVVLIPAFLLAASSWFIVESINPVSPSTELTDVDQYGTFDYRADLFLVSIQVIPDHLLFGTRKFRNDERMKKLVQGQGIIDMVNGFIHITIEYGLIAFFLLLWIFIRSYLAVTRLNSADAGEDFSDEKTRIAWFSQAFAALLIALAVQFSFTSYAATIVPLLWIAFAMARVLQLYFHREEERDYLNAAKAPLSPWVRQHSSR